MTPITLEEKTTSYSTFKFGYLGQARLKNKTWMFLGYYQHDEE